MVDFLIKSPKLTCDFMFKLAPNTGNPQFCIKGISPSGPSSEDTVHVLKSSAYPIVQLGLSTMLSTEYFLSQQRFSTVLLVFHCL